MNNTENRSIELSIKSLEQQIKSVSLPRNASVLELKSRIQVVFHVDSLRQRLIFQGKVLKDDKNLLDYENLDDGKVVHLVVRPLNAPIHPEDDEPRMTTNRRRHDGYTVITLSETRTPLLNRFTPSVPIQNSPFSPPDRSAFSSRPSIFQTLNSHRFDSRRTRAQENRNNIPAFPIPSSLDMRLSRTLAYIREIRTLLQTPLDETEIHRHQHNPRPTSLPAIQESRELLAQQPNQSAQVGLILNELAALFSLLSPYLREVSQTLTRDESTIEYRHQQQQLAQILRTSRIIQILSLSHHFLSSILSSVQQEGNPSLTETWTPGYRTQEKRKRDHEEAHGSSSSSKRQR